MLLRGTPDPTKPNHDQKEWSSDGCGREAETEHGVQNGGGNFPYAWQKLVFLHIPDRRAQPIGLERENVLQFIAFVRILDLPKQLISFRLLDGMHNWRRRNCGIT